MATDKPIIQQGEIYCAYNNRHAGILRQTSQNSNPGAGRKPSVRSAVSQEEDALILERAPSRKNGSQKEFQLYSTVQLNKGPGNNSSYFEAATPKERWQYLSSSGGSSSNPIEGISDAQLDDVFVEDPARRNHPPRVAGHPSVCSSTSTASMIQSNPYNVWNHKLHDTMWCSCCMYFFLICCIPAVIYMEKSDSAHKLLDDKRTMIYGKFSTILFVIGGISALLVYAALFFIVIYVSTVVL